MSEISKMLQSHKLSCVLRKGGYACTCGLDEAVSELAALNARIEKLEIENGVMYAALLEASNLGTNSAALRCKVELQRIARNEAE